LYKDCENELKLKTANKQQCSFVECYASFKDYKIVKCKPNTQTMHTSHTAGSLSQMHNQSLLNKPRKKSIEEFVDTPSQTQSNEQNSKTDDKDILIKILCNRQVCLKIFALIIEIIDNLLEDWYPDLGTRFMQDSKGDYLVTRLAPCNDCIRNSNSSSNNQKLKRSISRPNNNNSSTLTTSNLFIDPFSISASEENFAEISAHEEALPCDNELEFSAQDEEKLKLFEDIDWIYCFMLDDICYSVMKNSRLYCPRHGRQTAHLIAPELAFEDVEPNFLIENDSLKLESLLGRGSFGSVFSGLLRFKTIQSSDADVIGYAKEDTVIKVAVKVLETLAGNGKAAVVSSSIGQMGLQNSNENQQKNSHKKVKIKFYHYWHLSNLSKIN
jgi:hypothetical protein